MGILSVGSALKKAGIPIQLININELDIDTAVEQILIDKPFCVGISVMTGIQTMHSAELSKKIKKKSNIPILWGGIHPSLCSQQCINEEYIDYIIIGEGEITAIEFAQRLMAGQTMDGLLGLGHKKNNNAIIESRRPLISNLDEWRLNFGLLDMNKFVYSQGGYQRIIAYKTSRGCPFTCTFCYNENFNLKMYRTWSVDVVVEDIQLLKDKFQIDAVKFYDDNFVVSKKRTREILERINIPSHVEVRIDSINADLAQSLREHNCFDLLIGVESGSDRLLRLISKNIDVNKIFEAVRHLAKNQLPVTYSTIVGLPSETKEEFESTIDLMYQIYKIHPLARFTMGAYLPYPGSIMYDMAIQEGFSPPEKTEDWGKIDRFRQDFESPWVDVRKVWIIRQYFLLFGYKLGPIKRWIEFRIKRQFFKFPFEIPILNFLAQQALQEKTLFGKILRGLYKPRPVRNM